MKWIRSVRDEMFDKYYKGDLTEYSKAISTPAKDKKNKLSPREPIPENKNKKLSSNQRVKSFDAVKWTREVRDKMYEENKHNIDNRYSKKISDHSLDETMVKDQQKKYKKKD